MNDIEYMKIALDLAEKGRGYTSPNPMVGAVVVKDGSVVGKGYHEACGLAHAEVNAINDAGDAASGAEIYVTLEPCNHIGRTPACTEKILASGIRRVIIAMPDPNPDVKGGGIEYLKSNGIEVSTGVCEKEAEKQNEAYIKYSVKKEPFVIVKCAVTLDGFIATKTGDSKWISNAKSRKFVHKLRHDCDAILVGAGTVLMDNPSLTVRLDRKKAQRPYKDPVRVILDSDLSIDADSKILSLDSDAETLIFTCIKALGKSKNEEKNRIAGELSRHKNVKIIEAPIKDGGVNFKFVMKHLAGFGIMSLLIEGGSMIVGSAFGARIVDKVMFFYAPRILGGDDGISICSGDTPALMNESIQLEDIRTTSFDDDVMIEGYIIRSQKY